MIMLKRVADMYNCTIGQAARLEVVEFLGIYAYAIADEQRKYAEAKQQQARMRAKYRKR